MQTLRQVLALALTLLVLSASAWAQNVSLRGNVADELDAVIPGALITLTDDKGKERTATTDAAGNFVFNNVAPGTYAVVSSFTGFNPSLMKDVKVPTPSPLKIRLTVALAEQTITTSLNEAANNVEPDGNMTATVLGEVFIQNLPDNEDDLRNYLNALAGPGAGNGQGAQIIVDGFQNNQRLPP